VTISLYRKSLLHWVCYFWVSPGKATLCFWNADTTFFCYSDLHLWKFCIISDTRNGI